MQFSCALLRKVREGRLEIYDDTLLLSSTDLTEILLHFIYMPYSTHKIPQTNETWLRLSVS